MPFAPTPSSGGQPDAPSAHMSSLPHGKPGGEIALSRAEAIALAALETDADDKNPQSKFLRASKESQLDLGQVRTLHQRAEKARQNGYTLKGGNIVLKPKNYEPEGPGLLGQQEIEGRKTKGTPARNPGDEFKRTAAVANASATKKPQKKAGMREARLHECAGDRMCSACRQKAKLRLAEARRRKKRPRLGRTIGY